MKPTEYRGDYLVVNGEGKVIATNPDPDNADLLPGWAMYAWQHRRYILYRTIPSEVDSIPIPGNVESLIEQG